MLVYNYDSETKLFTHSEEAFIDPVNSQKEGATVYFLPANATFLQPYVEEGYISRFDEKEKYWETLEDNRGKYQIDYDFNISIIDYVGNVKDGFVKITDEQKEIIGQYPNYYLIVEVGNSRILIKNPEFEREQEEERARKEQEEAERAAKELAMLNMTKYDFYKCICKPNGISYPELMRFVNSDEEIAAAWNLCERVYRGDELLFNCIKQVIPDMTEEMLDYIFRTYGKKGDIEDNTENNEDETLVTEPINEETEPENNEVVEDNTGEEPEEDNGEIPQEESTEVE